MYNLKQYYPGARPGGPSIRIPQKDDTVRYDIHACLEEMKEAALEKIEGDEAFKEACTLAYAKWGADIMHGDPDPPSQKAMVKLAMAMAKDEVSKFSKELRDLSSALLQGTGETPTLFT